MESIPGYDDWKTTPPDDPEPASVCDCCGKYLWEGEPIYLDINGERNDENIQMLRAIRTIVNGERGKFIDKIITMYNDGIFDD